VRVLRRVTDAAMALQEVLAVLAVVRTVDQAAGPLAAHLTDPRRVRRVRLGHPGESRTVAGCRVTGQG